MCREAADSHPVVFKQSNAEFEIHEAIGEGAGIIINPAGTIVAGAGARGYPLAVKAILGLLSESASKFRESNLQVPDRAVVTALPEMSTRCRRMPRLPSDRAGLPR